MMSDTPPPTANGQPKRTVLSERERAQLKYVENLSGIRDAFWNRLINGSSSCDLKELWQACGYGDIDNINPQWYRTLYDTFSIANRICRLLPAETWQAPPSVYEDEDADSITEFEQAWDDLPKGLASGGQTWHLDEEGSVIWSYLEDLDVLSGIGSFGVMLLGIDDGKNLQDPVDGIQVLDVNAPSKETGKKKAISDTPFQSMKSGKVTEEQDLLNKDQEKGLIEPAMNYSNPDAACNQVRNKVSPRDQYPNVPQNPARTDPRTTQSFESQNHPNVQGRNPTSAGTGQPPPNQGYSDGTVGTPGAGPFVQGTDQQYERTSGMGMAYPAGAALSGTDQQYFGVQFGPSEEFGGEPAKEQRRLLFLRVFDESLVQVVRYEWNIRNPRFGLPVMYRITLNDPRTPHGGVGLPLATVYVHWSRVLHIPSGGSPVPSPIFGIPLMKPNLEHLLPLRKIYAADGQGYWKNAFNKLVLTTHPTLGGDVDTEQMGGRAQLQEDVDLFNDPMTNQALMLIGMDAKTLPPAVTDPTPHCEVHLKAIALQMDVPYPVFQGYEIGEQASENNQDIWNNRKRGRQLKRNTFILVSFIDRLIAVGVLPAPEKQKKESKLDGKTVKGDPDFVQKPLRPPGSQQPAAPAGGGGTDNGKPAGFTGPRGNWQAEEAAGGQMRRDQEQAPQKPQPTANVRSLGVWFVRGKPKELFTIRRGRMIYACNAKGDIEKDSTGKPKAVGVVTEAGYSIEWPDVDALSKKDQAAVCLQQVQADAAYIAGGNDQLIHPRDYLTRYKKFSEEEAEAILQTTIEAQQEQQEQADQLAEEQGFEPIPPEGYQSPEAQIDPHVVVGPGETLHHADDIKPGSPLKGQKQVPGAGPQQLPFEGGGGFPPGGGKGAAGKKPTVNELVKNMGATELRDHLGRWIQGTGGSFSGDSIGIEHLSHAAVLADMAEDSSVEPHVHREIMALRRAVLLHQKGEPTGVTKEHALTEHNFVHATRRNADGSRLRCRASGACKTWKKRPDDFRLPVKYGLRHSFYITPENAHEWRPARDNDARVRGAVFDLHQAVGRAERQQEFPDDQHGVSNTLRSHHALKADLIEACDELAKHELCMPGYGSLDVKNDGSGEVWWTGGDSDGEGFDDVVRDRLLEVEGVSKVYYFIEVPPPREGGALTGAGAAESGYTSSAPLWDEVWANQGREYRGASQLSTLAELGHDEAVDPPSTNRLVRLPMPVAATRPTGDAEPTANVEAPTVAVRPARQATRPRAEDASLVQEILDTLRGSHGE